MNISAKTEYACLALMELAAHYGSGGPVRIRNIAQMHGIPARFLVQILLNLKGAGLVASTRGAAGGYQLIKDPADITLADVVSAIEGQREQATSNAATETASSRALLAFWNEIGRVEQEMLRSKTLADLMEQVRGEAEQMYFI